MFIKRRKSLPLKIGEVQVGGDAPIVVQSMTNTDTRQVAETVAQIQRLERAGCEIVRVAVVDEEAARKIKSIKEQINIPLIADIHFNYKLALLAVDSNVDGLRLNPGNIGSQEKVRQIARAAKANGIPIRIGVNAGSLERRLLDKYGGVTPEAMVESALNQVSLLEQEDFALIKISLKASNVPLMIQAYRLLAQKVQYPFHIGVTEAGTAIQGAVKSAVGIGILLAEGIGDTIRVSLTGPPEDEIEVAYAILRSLGLRRKGVELIACPTCGRCELNLLEIVREVQDRLKDVDMPLKVAVMGCAVNGPGEAREADVGIAGGRGQGLLFRKGKIIKKVRKEEMVDALLEEIHNLDTNHKEE